MNICIIAHNSFGAISGDALGRGHIGGVENQTSMMARWLAARGHTVSLVTWDEGQADGAEYDGVKVFKMCRQTAGIRGVRALYPRLWSLFSAMNRADADIYYFNAAEAVTGQIAAWCRWKGKPFVYSSAQELDCHKDLPLFQKGGVHRPGDAVFYKYGLRNSTKIIVQTIKQQQLLKDGFGLDSVPLPMPCRGPETLDLEDDSSWKAKKIVWVARLAPIKRVEWLLELAPMIPDATFQLVGGNDKRPYAKALYEKAIKIPNIEWRGTVPLNQMGAIYKDATCLCCTSEREGFPNTFLEAWSWGKPVVSSFDPDGLIARSKLGIVSRDIQGLAKGLRQVLNSRETWRELGNNGRRYFETYHEINSAMRAFEVELESVLKTPLCETAPNVVRTRANEHVEASLK